MVTIIPKRLEDIWNIWNVRGAIIFSFLLQMFLLLFAPLRKRSDSMLLQFFIWTAYMLADWAANFTMGLITNNSTGGDNNDAAKEMLMALWAPFVLLHFGGPDTITAFSLEDNQLWLRQIPSLLFQVGASGYVFVLTLPRNTLWVPTLLVSVAGIIKCFERTRALYLANQTFGVNMKSAFQSLEGESSDEKMSASYFADLKRVKDLVFQRFPSVLPLRYHSAKYFGKIEDALKIIYERHYTKAPVLYSKVGRLLRFVVFVSMALAFAIVAPMEKTRGSGVKWDNTDVIITYTLFCGALLLEIISVLMKPIASFLSCLFGRPWGRSISGQNLIRLYLSKCQPEKPYRLCFKPVRFLEGTFEQIADSLGVNLELSKCKTKATILFSDELWRFIIDGIKIQKDMPKHVSSLKERINSAGEGTVNDVIEEIMDYVTNRFTDGDGYHFGRTLTLLHIATTLCYADNNENFAGASRRCSKLISDHMMHLFLMRPDMMSEVPVIEGAWTQETMVVEFISSEFIGFFEQNHLTSRHHEEEACRCVLSSPHYYNSSPPYPTVLLLARSLAIDLRQFQPVRKWKALTKIWVQMLIFAAIHSRRSVHVKYLPKGGELISFVWLAIIYWPHHSVHTRFTQPAFL